MGMNSDARHDRLHYATCPLPTTHVEHKHSTRLWSGSDSGESGGFVVPLLSATSSLMVAAMVAYKFAKFTSD